MENRALIHYLDRLNVPFRLEMGGEHYLVGDGEPAFTAVIHKAPDLKTLAASTSLALGEGYMRGDIEVEGDLYLALERLLGQLDHFSADNGALRKLIYTSVTKRNQKKEVSFHYDLGNDFYKLWLDETLNYSCGYFVRETDTLYDAQVQKTDRILKKLCLEQGMTLLDIGCGWGYLLIQAARQYGVKGVGITLSTEQQKGAAERVRAAGLEDSIQILLLDYRDLPSLAERFDRVVSVGMLEHVGRSNYDRFLSCAKTALKPGGLMLLHFISALKEHPGDAWIKKYIFPGGVIPSLREILSLSADHDFYILDVESLRRHYNKTLLCWDKNFRSHAGEVEAMFDRQFVRMWDLYLCSCAATFQNGIIDLHQILMSNGINNQLPMTRWY